MDLFDDEWISAAATSLADLPSQPGADVVIDYVIAGSPSGKVTLGVVVGDGQVVAINAGKSADPDLVISLKYDAAAKILTGELSSDAGYMNGVLKVEGAHQRWMLELRPVRVAAIEALAPLMATTTL